MTIEDIKMIKEIKDIEKEQNIISELYRRGEVDKLVSYVNGNILTKYVVEVIEHDILNPSPARTYEDYYKSVCNFLENIKIRKIAKSAVDSKNEKD